MIRTDMALGLDLAGLIVATFATLGVFFGLGAGVLVRRSGVRRSLIVGMGAVTIGNLIGAAAPNKFVLLIARIVEGAGFFATVLAIPSMLVRIVAGEERDFVMAMWSAYMLVGIMLMLLVGPLLPIIGWRNLWIINALVAGACGVLLAIYALGVQHFGWRAAPAIVAPAGLFGLSVALMIRRSMHCRTATEHGRRERKSQE